MKLTSMFESSSETPVVKCSQDGEKSDQSGALLVPVSADSCDLSSSKTKMKDDRSSPVLDIVNGNSDVQADLKKTLEPLSLNNGDGASSDDMERISCRTPVGDNDSSSEKENYLYDDGGSEASLKLRITESEDEGEMSPRATSPFEDVDQDCTEQILPQTEDHDGTNGETKDTEQNCDSEQQENEATEAEVSSPIVKDEDNEISGKLLRSDEESGPDTTCVQEKDCQNAHAESPGSDDCHSAVLVETEKPELCCDIASDSDTVKCSCDGVCSSNCTCSVVKQEIGSKLTTCTESNISLELDKCTAEHPVTPSGEQNVSLSTSDSHISVKECSSNNETDFPEDCSGTTDFSASKPTVSESEVNTDTAQNSSIEKENISEESVTDLETTGDVVVENLVEDEPPCVEKLVCPVNGDNVSTITDVLAIRENTESDSSNGDGNNDGDEDLTSKYEDCSSCLVEPVETKTSEVLPEEGGEVNGLSSADEKNYNENVTSSSNNSVKVENGVAASEVCVKSERDGSDDVKDSETVLALAESRLAASQNSVTVSNSVNFPGKESNDTKDNETILRLAESTLAVSENSITEANSVHFLREGSEDMKDNETILPLAESKLPVSLNSVTAANSVTFPGEGSDDTKSSETVAENKLAVSENSVTITNSVAIPDDSAVSSADVSQEDTELIQHHVEAISENVLEDKKANAEVPSAMSPNNNNKENSEACVDGKEILCNGMVDNSIGAVMKAKVLLTQESFSSESDKVADKNENMLMNNQTSDPGTAEKELEMKRSTSSVDVDLNVKGGETNGVIEDRLNEDEGSVGKEKDVESNIEGSVGKEKDVVSNIEGSVGKEKDVESNIEGSVGKEKDVESNIEGSVGKEKDVECNIELDPVTNKMSELENKTTDEVKDCMVSSAPEAELENHVKSPETDVGGSNTEKTTETELDRNITGGTLGDTVIGPANSCEYEEPLTLSDVANALKDAVDTVTLQDGESVPFTGCETSVPPLPSEVHNLPPSDMLISDNSSALAVHVADQEVQPENVQEAPGVTEAVRRRRKRSIEDAAQDRISKRTRGASLASSSGAVSPEKPTQISAESAKRSVSDSSAEEDAKRVRLNEEYDKVVKKIEQTVAPNGVVTGEIGSRRVFLEKIRAKDLKNLTVAELEEFFVEKICEALAYRHELGIMRQKQQAVENQMEIWRKKTLTMCKQVRDMELVMKRYQNDLKTRKDRPVIPVKVTRSVGLQVHDVSSDPSSRALLHKRKRMEQQASSVNTVQRPSPQSPLASNISTVPASQSASVSTRGTTSSPQYSRTATSTNSQANVPAAGNRVTSKPNNGLKTLMPRPQSVGVNTNTSTTSPTTANSSRAQQITRSKVASSAGNSPVGTVNKNSRQVIDLTDDGDRGRSAQPRTTAVMTSVNTNTVPANNSVGASTALTPTSSIRILPQPVTATAVAAGANILATGVTTNSNVPRLTYLVPTSNQLQQRPVLLASTPSQGVPNAVVTVTSGQKNQAPAVYVKNGAVVSVSPLVGSGAVGQQVPNAARPAGLQPPVAQGSPTRPQIRPAQILTGSPQSRSMPQAAQHPAPLPVAPNLNLNNPDLKKMPPRPELKISKQSRHQGIVLSWNMPVTNEYAAIASYQLYAYQESSSPPSTAHWKKVGDVKALPLPMACTLTQFVEGHKYHFAVRAVDIHSRVGPFSLPGSIVLTRK